VRIQIIGASGTGKSTLGHALSKYFGIPLLECDRYYWVDDDFRVKRTDEEKRAMMFADLATHESFVFTGAPQSWAQGYPHHLDLLVFLRLDHGVRIDRLRKRELLRYGERALPGGDHYDDTESFLAWAATYETSDDTVGNSLVSHRLLLSRAACPVMELSADHSVEELVTEIAAKLSAQL
jgi:adenylate kinase family enzyme